MDEVIRNAVVGCLTHFDIEHTKSCLALRLEPFDVRTHQQAYHIFVVQYLPQKKLYTLTYRSGDKVYVTHYTSQGDSITSLDRYDPKLEGRGKGFELMLQPDMIVEIVVELLMAHKKTGPCGWDPTVAGMGLKISLLNKCEDYFVLTPKTPLNGTIDTIVCTKNPEFIAGEIRRRLLIVRSVIAYRDVYVR